VEEIGAVSALQVYRPRGHMGHKTSKLPATPIRRRDASGHLDANYAAGLRTITKANERPGDGTAFLSGPRSTVSLAEELGEEFVHSALSGGDELQDDREKFVTEEAGGPFVMTSGRTEFAHSHDPSNRGATREPFPKT
jgi:hypothetical protein